MDNLEEKRILKRNIFFNLLDGGFFGFGLGFASFSTILPLFVAQMTNSALLIGLIPAIHTVGWQLPQLFTAKPISKLERYKPWVMIATINERLPFLGFAIIAFLLPKIGDELGLFLTFALLVWQGLGAGMAANGWQNMISKVIPSSSLSTFIGVQNALSNLLGSVSATLAGIALVKISGAYSYSSVFLAAFLCFSASYLCLNETIERPRIVDLGQIKTTPMMETVKKILKTDRVFISFLASRFLGLFGMMAFSFFTIYCVKVLRMDTVTVGIMTSVLFITQTIANPLLGWLGDRWSRRWILVIGGICNILSIVLALVIKENIWFSLPFILYGIANTAYWTLGITINLEFGNIDEKPTYVGLCNTLLAPAAILAPLLGGLLADLHGYQVTFYVSIGFSLLTLALLILFAFAKPKKQTGEL